ncbi:TPA: hypothetical protein EYP27_02745 [Candidatus Bathyarchaeota archaeon]|nr:hypothetical protein [Candidatus Bathyarchaeota archaeon]
MISEMRVTDTFIATYKISAWMLHRFANNFKWKQGIFIKADFNESSAGVRTRWNDSSWNPLDFDLEAEEKGKPKIFSCRRLNLGCCHHSKNSHGLWFDAYFEGWATEAYGLTEMLIIIGAYVGLRTGFFECGFTHLTFSRSQLRSMSADEATALGIGSEPLKPYCSAFQP